MTGERRELVIAGLRVAGPALVLAFFAGLYLHSTGKLSGVASFVGIMLLGAALGFGFGVLVWYASASASERIVKTLTGADGLPPAASFSYQESLVARGKPVEAREAYEAHLAAHPDDVNARLALARLWRDQLGDAGKAEQLYLEARRLSPTADQEFAIGNALIDLHRTRGDRGREMTELARFAERFAGTEGGAQARRALERMKTRDQ